MEHKTQVFRDKRAGVDIIKHIDPVNGRITKTNPEDIIPWHNQTKEQAEAMRRLYGNIVR